MKAKDLSAQIAEDIRDTILSGAVEFDTRLPSEAELCAHYNVSRATIREALKRLAAKNLIRTERGASGGAFVKRLRYDEASADHIIISTLLLSTNDVTFATACEARFALEQSCVALAISRREAQDIDALRQELLHQEESDLSDEDFCASDVRFHRHLVDCAKNPVLSYQLAGAVEAMQPLMNMITYTHRSRDQIIALHNEILGGLIARDDAACRDALQRLETYTVRLGETRMNKAQGQKLSAV